MRGTICGTNSWADIERLAVAHLEWFEQFLELPYGVPSHDTFGRLFARLDTEEFQLCSGKWVRQLQLQFEGQTIAIDGKQVRTPTVKEGISCGRGSKTSGSHDVSSAKQALHIVNAWANQVNICLRQVSIESRSNEIPAVQKLVGI